MYYGGFTWDNAQGLPIEYRHWFIKRINKEITKTSDGGNAQPRSRAFNHNTPESNAMQNKPRTYTPARLNRA